MNTTKAHQTVFHILDLDRTLLDTLKLAHTLKEIIARRDRDLTKDIDKEIKQHTEAKTPFYLFEYLAERIGQDKLNSYVNELNYIAPSSELLLPGATERIAFAKSHPGWSVGVLTYGSKRDQMIKLKLAGLQLERFLVIDSPKKGELLASWKRKDGRFKLPLEFGGHIVDILTLDDDSLVAFENMPEGVYGQWVTHASIGGVTELQKLPANVRLVHSLDESIDYLKRTLPN